MQACGLDFGTSNSAIGVIRDGVPVLVPADGDATLVPSAVFFDAETPGRILFGREAIAASVAQNEGRLMRALKSILASTLIHETTMLGKKRIPFTAVVEMFVRHLKAKAEAYLGEAIGTVVHGRPVRFVDGDTAADARAEAVLGDIARRAGFTDIRFVYEPIAAARHYEATVGREELVLVADIGGGTSDIAVIRVGPDRRNLPDRRADILASAGARIGGTDFDAALSLSGVMPLLGLGTRLFAKNLPMPKRLFYDLATWSTINFVYARANGAEARELAADAREPEKVSRLVKAIAGRHGHHIAFAVEDAKIALSDQPDAEIPLGFLEAGLAAPVARAGFEGVVGERISRLERLAAACIADAGVGAGRIDTIFLTGGSCRVPAVRRAIQRAAPAARVAGSSDFLSVALGLTEEARRAA
jgi:hypothetical chaperone protein